MKNLGLHNVGIDWNSYNWFINECARKNLAKIPEFLTEKLALLINNRVLFVSVFAPSKNVNFKF